MFPSGLARAQQVGPSVQILVADHPRNPDLRRERLEFGCPVVIRANVWIGGGPSSCQELRLEMIPLSVQEALSHVV